MERTVTRTRNDTDDVVVLAESAAPRSRIRWAAVFAGMVLSVGLFSKRTWVDRHAGVGAAVSAGDGAPVRTLTQPSATVTAIVQGSVHTAILPFPHVRDQTRCNSSHSTPGRDGLFSWQSRIGIAATTPAPPRSEKGKEST